MTEVEQANVLQRIIPSGLTKTIKQTHYRNDTINKYVIQANVGTHKQQ